MGDKILLWRKEWNRSNEIELHTFYYMMIKLSANWVLANHHHHDNNQFFNSLQDHWNSKPSYECSSCCKVWHIGGRLNYPQTLIDMLPCFVLNICYRLSIAHRGSGEVFLERKTIMRKMSACAATYTLQSNWIIDYKRLNQNTVHIRNLTVIIGCFAYYWSIYDFAHSHWPLCINFIG